MIENRYTIKDFQPELEKSLQFFENSFVTQTYFFNLIKIDRSFDQASYDSYFSQKYGEGFILILTDSKSNDQIVGKVLIGIKDVQFNKQTLRAAYIHELRIGVDCQNQLILQRNLIESGINKAIKDYKCQLAYLFLDQDKREEQEAFLQDELKFQKVGDVLSQISLQNNMIKVVENLGDNLKFKEVLPQEAVQIHSKQTTSGDFYCKQLFEQENTKTFIFSDEDSKNIYGMSVYFDDKRFAKNFSRFILSAKLLQNTFFIKLFYALVNCFFISLLLLERNDEGLLHDELKYKIVIYLGLNIGICLAFFQTQKAFKKFSGRIGRLFQPIEIETNPQTQMKKREIFETIIRNIQGKCFEYNISQIRVDMDNRCDHFDYFNSKSAFVPYNQNTLTFYAKSLNSSNIQNFNEIKYLSIDPRDF